MRGFFRRLFGDTPTARTPRVGDRFFLDIACGRCSERFHLHINRGTDCLQIFDEPGVAWRLQREVVGAQCRVSLQVRIDIGPGGEIVQREITGGRFLTPEEVSAAT
jgi:hypothetical protein